MRSADSIMIGEKLPSLSVAVAVRHIIAGAAASRDWQPQHHDHASALESGLPDIIMNTPTQAGWLERFVTDWSGPAARIGRLRHRMLKPICPGDQIQLLGAVEAGAPSPQGWSWFRLGLSIAREGQVLTEAAMLLAVPGITQPWQATAGAWHVPDWNLEARS